MIVPLTNEHIDLTIDISDDDNVLISGVIKNPILWAAVELKAAAPIDRSASYSGSGLPFPCAEIAFQNSPNFYEVGSASFGCSFLYPNSFYGPDARTKIPPAIFVLLVSKLPQLRPLSIRADLPDRLPLKTLTYRPERNSGPEFFNRRAERMGIKGQESILRMMYDAKVNYPTG